MKLFLLAFLLTISTAFSQQTINDLTVKKFTVVNTKLGAKPCPLMSESQRNAIAIPENGDCIYNTTTLKLNTYDGALWKAAGGGGIDAWETAFAYKAGNLIVQSSKIYSAVSDHTSGTFATDLADSKWTEISQGVTDHTALTNIGTNTHAQIDTHIANTSNSATATLTNKTISGLDNTLTNITATTNANLTGMVTSLGNATTVITNANLTGDVTSIGNATTIGSGKVTNSMLAGSIDLTSKVTGVLPIANGGTGSVTKNFADLTTTQTIAGVKTFSNDLNFDGEVKSSSKISSDNLFRSNNFLINPSFENATILDGWTCSVGTASTDSTNKVDGSKSLGIISSGSGFRCQQLITTNAASLKGQQAHALVPVMTTDNAVNVCAIVDNVDTNCKVVQTTSTDSPFKSVPVEFIMGGTNNGVVIKSATTTALATSIDRAEIKLGLPNSLRIGDAYQVGNLKYATAANCIWGTSSTTMVNYSADTDCATPVVTGELVAPVGKTLSFTLNAKVGTYYFVANGLFLQSSATAGSSAYRFSDGTLNSSNQQCHGANMGCPTITGSITYTSAGSKTINLQGSVSTASQTNQVYAADANRELEISVYYFPPANQTSSYLAANGNTEWAPCGHTASDFTGFGTVTNIETQCKKDGGDLLMRGKFTSGTSTAVEARLNLKLSGTALTSANSSSISSIQPVGIAASNESSGTVPNFYTMVRPSEAFVAFSRASVSSTAFYTPVNGNAFVSSGSVISLNARIPIAGWGSPLYSSLSFANMEKCANDYECADGFKALISAAGVPSLETPEWINGNAVIANTSEFTLTFQNYLRDGVNPLTSNMVCEATAADVNSNNNIQVIAQTLSTITVKTAGTGAANARAFNLTCWKTLADFKPKTAKIATSIGVPTVPGIVGVSTGERVDTFKYNFNGGSASTACTTGSCTVNQIGTALSIVTRSSTGTYANTYGKTYTKLQCDIFGVSGAASNIGYSKSYYCENCNTLSMFIANSNNTALADGWGFVDCLGAY